MDENLRETTELPESGGTAPNEENEPETKSIRFVPSAYDPRGIEQWLSERAAEGKLLLRYDDFVIGEPRDCRYHLEPAADDDDPDETLREKRARLGWEYVCRTKDGIFYIWRGDRTAHVPAPKDCTDSYGYRRLCKKLRRSYFLPMIFLVVDIWLVYFLFSALSLPVMSFLTMEKSEVIQFVSIILGSILGILSEAKERKEMWTLKRAMEACERVEKMPRNRWAKADRALTIIAGVLALALIFWRVDDTATATAMTSRRCRISGPRCSAAKGDRTGMVCAISRRCSAGTCTLSAKRRMRERSTLGCSTARSLTSTPLAFPRWPFR